MSPQRTPSRTGTGLGKLARLIYFMLKNQAEYQDPGFAEFEKQHRERAIHNLKRKAAKLGLKVVPGTV